MKGIVKNRANARQIKDNNQPFSDANSESLGLLNITAEFEFNSKDVVTCAIGGKARKMAKATLLSGGYAEKAGQPPSPFWVCIDEPFVDLRAQAPTQFDSIVKCNQPIRAGDAIGFMGLYEVPKMPAACRQKVSKHQVHIEIFSTDSDSKIQAFLNNEAALKTGKQYIKISAGASIYIKDKDTISFSIGRLKTQAECIVELTTCKKMSDSSSAIFYKVDKLPILNGAFDGYISETELEILSQYELTKLGFKLLEEKNTNADGYLDPEKMPVFFQQLYKSIDKDSKNGVDSAEIAAAFKDQSKRNQLVKLVAKHPSEWHKSTINTIKTTFSNWASEATEDETKALMSHEKERMEKLEWMSQITTAPLVLGPAVWHLNPINIIESIRSTSKPLIWMSRVIKLFGHIVAEQFRHKVISVSDELKLDPNYMMACFALETGVSFKTDIKNPNSSASGLIQFMESTAKELGTTTEKLRAMGHVEQMDFVKMYFLNVANQVGIPTSKWTLHDVYLSIFTPSAIKKKADDHVYRDGQDAYKVNMYHDVNKDGVITKKEICSNIDEFYKKGMEFVG
jgi:hypothetical protein